MSPLTLAFVGDGVYELLVREHVVAAHGSMPAKKLHQQSVELVRASYQAAAYDLLEPVLSEKEQEVLRRGRNANSASVPKHADLMDYRKATGVETLFGYLYLNGDISRVEELFRLALAARGAEE
ncbi:MAG: ribonuclease III domain-containing protein [Oscillospiraceae bacterium]|nr:ribonuclease III domain-containing protein [Oscillospiraceae bacterium]